MPGPSRKLDRPKQKGKGPAKTKSGAKRARLDETVSPRGESKRPKTTATETAPKSYAAAAASSALIRCAVTSKTGFISRPTAEQIEEKLEEAFLQAAMSTERPACMREGLAFSGKPLYADGCLRFTCTNTATFGWFQQVVRDLHDSDLGELVVLRDDEIPKRVRCGFVLPKLWKHDQALLGKCLQIGNPDLTPERWLLNGIQQQPTIGATFVVVSIPEDIVPAILARGRRLSFMFGSVYLKFRDAKGKYVDTLPTSDPSAPLGAQTTANVTPAPPIPSTSSAGPTDTVILRASSPAVEVPRPSQVASSPLSEECLLELDGLGLEDVDCQDDGLRRWLETNNTAVALIQEPWIRSGTVRGLSSIGEISAL
ncbi:hypothetical protein evm_010559 [Chilo suppressalis]|nr:hypothetical protein evm_010559 [Chilo suppressalis]